jgi:capsular polysaccharide biosynthesis protein
MNKKPIKIYFLWLIIIAFVISCIVFFVFRFQEQKYQATEKILITKQYSEVIGSAYSESESSKHTADVLAEVIQTNNFIKDVYNQAGVFLDNKYLNSDLDKIIKAKVAKDVQIIEVTLYHKNPNDLKNLSQSLVEVLELKKAQFEDTGKIKITIVDPAYISSEPVEPKPWRNALAVFVAIVFIGGIVVYTIY